MRTDSIDDAKERRAPRAPRDPFAPELRDYRAQAPREFAERGDRAISNKGRSLGRILRDRP